MLSKRGFTLIELITVVVLLALMAIMIIPPVMDNIDKSKTYSHNQMVNNIENVTKLYISNHKDTITNINVIGTEIKISLQDLVSGGLLKAPIIDPKTEATISLDSEVSVCVTGRNQYNVSYEDIETCSAGDYTAPVIALVGSSTVTIIVGDNYTDPGVTATDTKDGDLTSKIIITSILNTNLVGTYTITYNVYDKVGNAATPVTRTVNVVSYYIASEGVNMPSLAKNMTAIKWNSGTSMWDTVTNPDTDTSWYNYTNKEWANAKTGDGSYWVWIPRYAYQIASGYHTNTTGTINIKFLQNKSNMAGDKSIVDITPTYSGSSQTNYIKHPAFTFGTKELTGIWVAKFEASTPASSACYTSVNPTNCNVTNILPLFIPNAKPWQYISIGNIFTISRNMEINNIYGWDLASGLNVDGTFTTDTNNVDTHLIKNSEWGAVAYLAQSSYGKNAEITINDWTYDSIYYTGGGPSDDYIWNGRQGTTGNIYGIYDMVGGGVEYVMGNYNNSAASSGLTPSNINNKYINIYTAYDSTKYGDAFYETSSSSGGSYAWYSDSVSLGNSSYPWFMRGGHYFTGQSGAGLFNSGGATGGAGTNGTWRSVVLVGTGL